MAAQLIRLPSNPIFDGGTVASGAVVKVYASGTTTQLATYTDGNLSVAAGIPQRTANADGVTAPIYFDDVNLIRLVVENASGTILHDEDPYLVGRSFAATPSLSALHFISWNGQSLQSGNLRGANHTVTQEHGIRALEKYNDLPSAFFPAIATSQTVTGSVDLGSGQFGPLGESPMFGSGYLGELLEAQTGQSLAEANLNLLLTNNARGSTNIAQNSEGGGTGDYERVVSQLIAAKALAPTVSSSVRCDAVMYNQGEADNAAGTSYSTYKAALVALQASFDTDIRAVVPSDDPVRLILNQTNSATANDGAIARAQLDASLENDNIIFSTPKYMCEYYDNLHFVARDAKWIGGYDILAWYYTVILGLRWTPLHFVVESVVGNDVTLFAVGRSGSLVIDETTIPAQTKTNMIRGFTCVDGGGSAVAPTAVALVGADRIKVTLASVSSGFKLRYALAPAVSRPSAQTDGLAAYDGGAGNIRDSFGSTVPIYRGNGVNRPMHKWAAAQEWTL